MGDVYIYNADEEDFSTIGLCGTLMPMSCTYHEIANGSAELTLEHPMDSFGRYLFLKEMRILKCEVPVRTTPEIRNGEFATVVYTYKILDTATKANLYIYNKRDPSAKKQKKLKLTKPGDRVTVTETYEQDSYRWKVKYTYKKKTKGKEVDRSVEGWMAHDQYTLDESSRTEVHLQPTSTGIEAVEPSWNVREQLFRIDSIEMTEKTIHVNARHIFYDLMYNLTSYNLDSSAAPQTAAEGILNHCFEDHSFTFKTNIKGALIGHHYRDTDPVTALMDQETGLIPRMGGQLIRDNFQMTVLNEAGTNRGTMLTYGKNVKGISISVDMSDVYTAVRPVGETTEKKEEVPLYLQYNYLWDGNKTKVIAGTDGIVYGRWHYQDPGSSELQCLLPFARIDRLDGDECKVDAKKGPNAATVRSRLLQQATDYLDGGAEQPEVSVKVDLQLLGFTGQFAHLRALEKLFLFDTVRVRHPDMNIDIETTVTEIEWDCLNDMPLSISTDNKKEYEVD